MVEWGIICYGKFYFNVIEIKKAMGRLCRASYYDTYMCVTALVTSSGCRNQAMEEVRYYRERESFEGGRGRRRPLGWQNIGLWGVQCQHCSLKSWPCVNGNHGNKGPLTVRYNSNHNVFLNLTSSTLWSQTWTNIVSTTTLTMCLLLLL